MLKEYYFQRHLVSSHSFPKTPQSTISGPTVLQCFDYVALTADMLAYFLTINRNYIFTELGGICAVK